MRHRRSPLLATLALAVTLHSPAHAYDLATNGNFEVGNLSSWQVYLEGGAGWFVNDRNEAPITGNTADPPPHGTFQAIADEEDASVMILYRDFAIPPTLKATLKVTYWINNTAGAPYSNSGTLSASGPPNQKVRIDLQNPASFALLDADGVLDRLFFTTPATPLHVGATTITKDVTFYAGSTIRLRIAVVVTGAVMNVGIDDVSLEVSPFTPLVTNLEGGHHGDAAWGDYDNDGDLDLAIGGATNDANLNVVYRHNADGTMTIAPLGLPLQQKNGYAWGDYDQDGDVDLAMMGYGLNSQTDIYRNDGGTLTPIGAGLQGLSDGAAAWGDYDNDGDLDLVTTGWDGSFTGYCQLYRNDGGGSFVQLFGPTTGLLYGSIQWGDFNSDGNLDVLACGFHPDFFSPFRATQVALGDGTGNFTLNGMGLPALDDGMARWADFDGDGYLDVAIAGSNGSSPVAGLYLYDPGFQTYLLFIPFTAVRGASLAWGDFDNDGDPDLVVAGTTGSVRSTTVYRNDGGTSLVDIGAALPGVQDGVVLWADYDGDRDLDLLVSGDTGAGYISRVYRNTSPGANAAPSPPTLFAAVVQDAGVIFASDGPSDDHTGAPTSNLRIGGSVNGVDAVSPMSNVGTGYRRVVQPGNVSSYASRFIKFSGLGHGTVHWALQGVDGSWIGGPFSADQTLVLGADLLTIADVPGDQGGRVRLTIARSQLDNASRTQFPISGYNVWRRVAPGSVAHAVATQGTAVDAARATQMLRGADAGTAGQATTGLTDLPLVEWSGRRFARGTTPAFASPFPPGTWELLGSFFSQQQAQYLYNASTAADSGVGGLNWTAFVVTAHTNVPSVWYASEPDSGKSVDNLAPGPPLGLVAHYHTGSGNALSWQPAPEPDFQNFRVYRGATAGFVPAPGNLVASVATPAFTDPAFDNATVFYKVSTTDHAGNESAKVAPGQTTATEGPTAPLQFALRGAAPNPFGASTGIGFALPHAERVALRIYDTTGRLVRTLVDGTLAPGDHEIRWGGEDDAGHALGVGVYFLRMNAGSFQASKRLLRVR